MSFPPSSAFDFVTEVYIGYYDRSPDTVGEEFWVNALISANDSQTTALTRLANLFANSSESTAIYPYLTDPTVSPASFVTQVYNNILNRAPDAAGLNFWINQLNTGATSAGGFIVTVEASVNMQVGTADALTLANKITVAEDYVQRITDADTLYTHASAFGALVQVTNDPATVAQGEAVTTAFLNHPITLTATAGMRPVTAVTGNTFFEASTDFGDLLAQPGSWSLPMGSSGTIDLTKSGTFGTSASQVIVPEGVFDHVTALAVASWAINNQNFGLVNASETELADLGSGNRSLFDATTQDVVQGSVIGGGADASANVIAITDATFANAAAVAQALASGAYNLSLAGPMRPATSFDMIFAYSDGTNTHIADVNVLNGKNLIHPAGSALSVDATAIHVSDMVQLTGLAAANGSSVHFNLQN
jgi:Domain of unknown function (DUF4214)